MTDAMSADEVKGFLSLVVPLLSDWDAFEVRAIAQRSPGGQWVLNCMRAILGPTESVDSISASLPRLKDLILHHERIDIKRLPGFLESLAAGDLPLGEEQADLRRPNTRPPEPSLYVRKISRRDSRSRFGIDFPCIVLSGGESLRERFPRDDFDTVDARLRTSDPPWDGLADVRRTFAGIDMESAPRRDWSSIDVVAPLGAHLLDHELAGSMLLARVEARRFADPRQIVLALIAAMADGFTVRLRHTFGAEEKGILTATFRLPQAMLSGSLSLTYREMDAERLEVYGKAEASQNPRLAVLDELVGGAPTLVEGLRESSGKRLEEWASLLFDALGFAAARFGFLPEEAPDLIAFPDSKRWFLVVECTSREPDLGGKLAKLSTRAKELSRRAGLRAYPVVVTGLDRTLLNKTDLEKAEKELIAVISASEFGELVALALSGPSAEDVRGYLERLIPRETGSSLAWLR